MCFPAVAAALPALFGGAATAAGATAGAATALTFGQVLQGVGAIAGIGGSIASAVGAKRTAAVNANLIEGQKATEANLTATEDARTRLQFQSAMRRQRAELASRGIDLGSPTAVLLGQNAAQELSFASQSIRSGGAAKQAELTASQRMVRARGMSDFLSGTANAAGTFLTAAPEIWPGLLK
jgi:hypothetical protein